MKKIVLLFLLNLCFTVSGLCQNIDSLTRAALTYAAHNNIAALRPLYRQQQQHLPQHVRLYCDMAISHSEGSYERVVECIDSLRKWYPKSIAAKTQLSLSELKAESLRQLGEYEALYHFCKKEISYFKKRRFKPQLLKELLHYQEKAARLSGNSYRARLLQLADRYLPVQLEALYREGGKDMDKFTRLRCETVLAQAFHRPRQFLETSRQLITEYADSLDNETLTHFIKQHADVLIHRGDWKGLEAWTASLHDLHRNQYAPMPLYQKLSAAFRDKPAYEIRSNDSSCLLPTTYEWPLLVTGTVNNGAPISFALSTEQPYTFIGEETARKCGVQTLDDTLHLSTADGFLTVSPAWVDQLSLGSISFNHLYAYVVHDSNDIPSSFANSIGLNELLSLSSITLLPEQILLKTADEEPAAIANQGMYLSIQNGLRLLAYDSDGKVQPLSLDINYPNNIFSRKCLSSQQQGNRLDISVGGQHHTIHQPVFVGPKAQRFNGILGLPFARNYSFMRLDFRKMAIETGDETGYHPVRGRFGHSSDKNYLVRNYAALTSTHTITQDEQLFLDALIAIGKNSPCQVAAISSRLRADSSAFYNAYTEAESLFLCGKYKAATQCLREQLAKLPPHNEYRADLQHLLLHYQLYEQAPEVKIQCAQPEQDTFTVTAEGSDISVNRKKATLFLKPFTNLTVLSEKSAKKLKVKLMGKYQNTQYGLLTTLQCGPFTLHHLPCIIVKDKVWEQENYPEAKRGICLGWDALRHFNTLHFKDGNITLSLHAVPETSPAARLYHNGHWYVEAEADGTYPTLRIEAEDRPAAMPKQLKIAQHPVCANGKSPEGEIFGTVSAGNLLKVTGSLTIDTRKMLLSFE